jgi:trehalose transport system permease protein
MKWVNLASIVILMYFLFPLYILFLLAFNSTKFTILARYPSLLPEGLTLANLMASLQGSAFIDPFLKSLETATLVGIITVVLAIPAGYGLSRMPRSLAYPILITLLVTNMMPAIVIGIPIAVEFIKLHLFETVPGLALAQTLITLPLATFILQGTFSSIPRELESQARIDGAGLARLMSSVLLPLAGPGIAAAFLISWMFSWDEFTYAILIIPFHSTLPVTIYSDVTRGNLLAGIAFSLVFTLPVVAITLALQKYLKGEYLTGGIKG